MLSELTLSSWETIAYRSMLMASGACSLAEYTSMVTEKLGAAQLSTISMLTGGSLLAMLTPWHSGATANAIRLRRG